MSKALFLGSLALALAACAGGEAKEAGKGGRAAGTATTTSTERTVAGGTRINANIQDALSSRVNKAGEPVRATIASDVADSRGNVAIPSGSIVTLTIDQLEPGSDQVRPEGRLALRVTSVTVNGTTYPASGTLDPIPHEMKGRGITTDEAARIAAGTAIGAAAGQVIGKNTKSTVIGGAVGAVAGGAVAVRYAYRDVVVAAGTPIVITLAQALNISAR